MRLLADENIPLAAVKGLRAEGHDVLSVSESMPSAGDREVLARARVEHRILVTFDRDFGTLVFKHLVSAPAGIVLLRFAPVAPEEPATILMDLLGDLELRFSGKFTVVDRERVRQRSLEREDNGS
ncbi:MAG: DUF5615 family PIN-like protein [Nitrococcus sp.]|nr:DUF5615 family PIN-like protein [Nitrococcus sp.]